MRKIKIIIDKKTVEKEVKSNETLLETLLKLNVISNDEGFCGEGRCGRCIVLVDGLELCSCLLLTFEVEGKEISLLTWKGGGLNRERGHKEGNDVLC